jgi:phosphoglycolate phosphatase
MSPQTPRAILFDFDLTLADSARAVAECANRTLIDMGYSTAPESEVRATIGHPLQTCFRMITRCADPDRAEEFKTRFVAHADRVMSTMIGWFPEALPALNALRGAGVTMGIVSTKYRYRIEEILANLESSHLFDVIIGEEDVAALKPDPEGLLQACARLGAAMEDCLYVGDTLIDWETARAAGCAFVGVLSGATTRRDFEREGATVILNHVGELPGLLGSRKPR